MKGYDSLLFRALIGANQLEFKENMDSAESAEYSYSPRYNRFRLQILADPFRWAKKRRRPMWQKIITNVACIILVCFPHSTVFVHDPCFIIDASQITIRSIGLRTENPPKASYAL